MPFRGHQLEYWFILCTLWDHSGRARRRERDTMRPGSLRGVLGIRLPPESRKDVPPFRQTRLLRCHTRSPQCPCTTAPHRNGFMS